MVYSFRNSPKSNIGYFSQTLLNDSSFAKLCLFKRYPSEPKVVEKYHVNLPRRGILAALYPCTLAISLVHKNNKTMAMIIYECKMKPSIIEDA